MKKAYLIAAIGLLLAVGGVLGYIQLRKDTWQPTAEAVISRPARIVAMGDMVCAPDDLYADARDPAHCQSAGVQAVAAKRKPDMVIGLGDLQYQKGELANFQKGFDRQWGSMRDIFYPAPGNHEYETPAAQGYFDYFGAHPPKGVSAQALRRGYYSYDIGKWHIISLNSTCEQIGGCSPQSPQLAWLENDLRKNDRACTLAFWHYPRFSSGRNNLEQSAPFWDKLYAHKADVILSAHDHLYERFALQRPDGAASADGLRQFTVGTGGRSLHSRQGAAAHSQKVIEGQFGVLALDLSDTAYHWEFITPDNKVLDSGTGACRL